MTVGYQPTKPEECKPGQHIPRELVADWPALTKIEAVNFRRFTGLRLGPDSKLVRKGVHIFEVGAAAMARCQYAHSRDFKEKA